ncbi:hypothetical protein VCUG_00913 [Vavraia culicis subsp. floridensis]|uniref:Uncharacterized protein n=1 Tax=Vavraia culicis (isolate floridensis) TaxID=948595 RepID=L2GWX0_VAVCU|nr:uncharacterized protein VCUG_00913 [Vavraia culicis subsp. floridensis]ELA47590.1 hypothetical protein VCUG_00913 [Vavraia culicis subsp. floridensis]
MFLIILTPGQRTNPPVFYSFQRHAQVSIRLYQLAITEEPLPLFDSFYIFVRALEAQKREQRNEPNKTRLKSQYKIFKTKTAISDTLEYNIRSNYFFNRNI